MNRSLAFAAALFFALPLWAADAPPAPPAPASPPPPKPFVYTPKSTDIVIGKDNAPVTIVEYASLSCPHCAHFYTQTLPPIESKYVESGKVKLVYRDFPLNDPAVKAAVLAHCAPADQRPAFLKVLFSTQSKWAYDQAYKESLANIGAIGGIDRAAFDACMNDKALSDSILAVAKEAETDYRVQSTPTFFIGAKKQEGDGGVEVLSKAIDEALAASAKK